MISRPRSVPAKPSRAAPLSESSKMLDLLSAVELRDRRVARAVFGLPWKQLDENAAPATPERVRVLVRMLEALELTGGESVLDIGTGAGYRAALLGKLAGRVLSIEQSPNVAAAARGLLERMGIQNVEVVEGDGSLGWRKAAPYDAILMGCASPDVPHELIDQLTEGGRLVIPVGDSQGQLIERLRRHSVAVESSTVAPCSVRPLAFRGERRSSVPWVEIPDN
jgi:protein-L-isoaspartate(D-aspartate) O-methyltransferase